MKAAFQVNQMVERDLDGLLFAAKVINVYDSNVVDIQYTEDENIEKRVPTDELRILERVDQLENNGRRMSGVYSTQVDASTLKDALLFENTDYDPNKVPKVVIHNRNDISSDSGCIINGLENNIAAGNGLRGIRFLRDK